MGRGTVFCMVGEMPSWWVFWIIQQVVKWNRLCQKWVSSNAFKLQYTLSEYIAHQSECSFMHPHAVVVEVTQGQHNLLSHFTQSIYTSVCALSLTCVTNLRGFLCLSFLILVYYGLCQNFTVIGAILFASCDKLIHM